MKDRVYIIGVGMTPIVKMNGGTYEHLCSTALAEAMADAGLCPESDQGAFGAVWYGNCAQGLFTSQHSIRGQVVLRRLGFMGRPVINVENACATGSTALHQAIHFILAGGAELALAVAVEKMMPDFNALEDLPEIAAALPHLSLSAFWMGCEQDRKRLYIEKWRRDKSSLLEIPFEETDVGGDRSPFMDYYAVKALKFMHRYGCTQEQLARVCAKTHHHGSLNPKAQYRMEMSWQEVLADKPITYPLTRSMCAPIGEGCAAAIVCSEKYMRHNRENGYPVEVLASVLVSGRERGDFDRDISGRGAELAFRQAGLDRREVDLLELHDATSFSEIYQTAQAGFCRPEDAGAYCASGATALGGELPTNVSGGLVSRGHPVGCTGLAQTYELVTQLRGRAGARQVKDARIGMQINGGGVIGVEEAALGAHIYRRAW